MCWPRKKGEAGSQDQLTSPKSDLARPDQCISASTKYVCVRASCQAPKRIFSPTVASNAHSYHCSCGLFPLLEKEGWREAPGWSVRPSVSAGLTTPSARTSSSQPPLLFKEGK